MQKRLLLFDIDGTLMFGRGITHHAFLTALEHKFPEPGGYRFLKASGLTDRLIFRTLMEINLPQHPVSEQLIKELLDIYQMKLLDLVTPARKPEVLDGVKALLDFCQQKENCYLGLVTGNIAEGARHKLKLTGLSDYFAVGAFGSDHEDRNRLPQMAIRRADIYFNTRFNVDNVWIIGDSIPDIRCAKANHIKVLSVATGLTEYADLEAERPDMLLRDLSDTKQVTEILGIS